MNYLQTIESFKSNKSNGNFLLMENFNRVLFNLVAKDLFTKNKDYYWSYAFCPNDKQPPFDIVLTSHLKLHKSNTNSLSQRFILESKARNINYDSFKIEKSKLENMQAIAKKYNCKAIYLNYAPSSNPNIVNYYMWDVTDINPEFNTYLTNSNSVSDATKVDKQHYHLLVDEASVKSSINYQESNNINQFNIDVYGEGKFTKVLQDLIEPMTKYI